MEKSENRTNRTITLKLLPRVAVQIKTEKEFKKLMVLYEMAGRAWEFAKEPTNASFNFINIELGYNGDICIDAGEMKISYSCKKHWEDKGYEIISFAEFLELQGLTMLAIPA